MTPERLEQIKARVEKATEGPWAKHPALAQVDAFNTGVPVPVFQALWPTDLRSEEETEANEEFIAHARQDVPDLVAEVERLFSINVQLLIENERLRARSAITGEPNDQQ
jgi:hypothetical protein